MTKPATYLAYKPNIDRENPKTQKKQTHFVYPTMDIANRASYIVWNDKKLVIFYTNDLTSTPSKPILNAKDKEAINCVRGLKQLKCWTGDESFTQTFSMSPCSLLGTTTS